MLRRDMSRGFPFTRHGLIVDVIDVDIRAVQVLVIVYYKLIHYM